MKGNTFDENKDTEEIVFDENTPDDDRFKEEKEKQNIIVTICDAIYISIAVVASWIRVAMDKLFSKEPSHFNFTRTVERAKNELDKQTKKEPEKKEPKKKESEKREPEKKEPEKDPKVSEVDWEVKFKEDINDILKDKVETNNYIDIILAHSGIQNTFKDKGLTFINDSNSKYIYVLSKNKEMDISQIPVISKKDFLMGNVEPLIATDAFYNKNEDYVKMALEDLIITAKIKEEIHRESYKCEIEIPLASQYIVTEQNNLLHLSVVTTSKFGEYMLKLNGDDLGKIKTDDLDKVNRLLEKIKEYESHPVQFSMGKVQYEKTGPELMAIHTDGKSETFRLHEEIDLQKIKDFLVENGIPEREAEAQTTIAAIKCNPAIEKTIDEYGFELNPFKNEPVDSTELYIDNTEMPPKITIFMMVPGTEAFTEKHVLIDSVLTYDKNEDLDTLVTKVIAEMERDRSDRYLMAPICPKDEVGYKDPCKNPTLRNAEAIMKEVVIKSAVTGMDLSMYKFKESDQKEPDKKEIIRQKQDRNVPESAKWEEEEGVEAITEEEMIAYMEKMYAEEDAYFHGYEEGYGVECEEEYKEEYFEKYKATFYDDYER